ncbi:hypothetical protein V8G54_020916 [Vigna mungo]|uniref:Uncharacterized protein n=1 Tax=Vigna mungo TaxID=3915 RepID=A0AAQ3NEM8_VIGMU
MVVDFSEEEPNLEPTSVVHSRPSVSVLDGGPPQSSRILSVGLKSCATTSSIANTKHTNNGTQTQYRSMLHITTQNSKPKLKLKMLCFLPYNCQHLSQGTTIHSYPEFKNNERPQL